MTSEAVLRVEGMEALIARLGSVDAERFIASIIREPFDYTEWQKTLFDDLSIDELSEKAQVYSDANE
ncbi:MAG: hypothetical protein FWD45_02105 [Coriobacteriia bacterium]|nr:hypothetical protein [Coriobacteriia bacterium]